MTIENTAERLHSAAIRLLRSVRKADCESGLSAPRLSALSVVLFGGPMTLGALAAAEQVRPPTMTRLVDGLAGDGLVARLADAEDRRVVRVEATAKGRELLMRARGRRVATLTDRLRRLSAEERRILDQAAELIERAMRDAT